MKIDEELRHRIGLSLNEATLLGVEFDREKNLVACSFSLVAIDKDGNVPQDNRVLFIFKSIGRFAASYRNGHWDNKTAEVEKFEPEKISEIVQCFEELSIYGWDFINCGDNDFDTWKDRLSFDYSSGIDSGLTNTIDLFQEGGNRHIDIRIWFDEFEILTPTYQAVELEDFLANGKRGWDAVYANNDKIGNFGIIPSTTDNKQKLKETTTGVIGNSETKNWWTEITDKFKRRNEKGT
ncbi:MULTISPECIES: hypothetical protein [unclassified Pedobacter]|uniref:hypothetical protein n=1 Tax=unclassified Pedobacter TaxID=2628915 RepID=UPI001D64E6A2|nr:MULTISPECIES: hypothetical protein [unclassified Pedobacter]CAH0258109.1 hypothetical protein SRABI36_03393 [Pedobacter sp. Bi36]CAH0285236.1 hypothetical protein SRABI126_03888 [Pedobacter sp. Bi126]